jgi:AraC-like DNA-binding protein
MPAIAQSLGLGYAAFRKAFTRAVGMSPGAYRIRCRLERAQEMLVGSDEPMERIAERLGYCDPYAFAAQFKRFMGMAPGRLRRLNRTPGAME